MKTLATTAIASCIAASSIGAPPDGPGDMTPEEIAAFQQEMMAQAQPGPEHKTLERLAGEWDFSVKFHYPDEMTGMKYEGRAVNQMILGNRFLESKADGEMMGMPVGGLYILGFDRRHDHYTVTGFDSQGTYSVSAVGEYDEELGAIRLEGTTYNPKLDHTEVYYFLIRIEDDRYTWEVWFQGSDGAYAKMVEIENTRVG